VHTHGVDGLLHLYQRLEKRNRALLLCLLCAEAGWLILVNAGCGWNAPTLSSACFCECDSQQPRTKNGEARDIPIAGTPPTRLRRRDDSLTASIFDQVCCRDTRKGVPVVSVKSVS